MQFALEEILNDLRPQILGLARDGSDAALVEELARLGIAADVETAHHGGHTLRNELQRQVASTGILIGLDAGQTDQQFHAVLVRLLLHRLDSCGDITPSQVSSQMTVSRWTLRSTDWRRLKESLRAANVVSVLLGCTPHRNC